MLPLEKGQRIARDHLLRKLVEILYERNDLEFGRGTFRVRGDIIEVHPSYDETAIRIGLFGDEVDELATFDPITGKTLRRHDRIAIYPKTHFVTTRDRLKDAVETIKAELTERRGFLEHEGQVARGAAPPSAHDVRPRDDQGDRLLPRDRELLAAPHRPGPGEPPPTLLDYLPADALVIVDESHQTVPQVRGMYFGDRSRKEVLVEYGFRLPSALDNRPLNFDEWEGRVTQISLRLSDARSLRARTRPAASSSSR